MPGAPVQFFLTPVATAGVTGLRDFDFDLPAGALVVGDKAYNDYAMEDVLCRPTGAIYWPTVVRWSKPLPAVASHTVRRPRGMRHSRVRLILGVCRLDR